MTEIPDIELYHEIREKVALAAENQALVFLPDNELDLIVKDLYESIYNYKKNGLLKDFYFSIEKLSNNQLFIAMHQQKAAVQLFKLEEQINNDVFDAFDFLVSKRLKEDPNSEIKAKTYIKENKIIIEIF